MRRIIDMEIEAPLSEAALRAQEIGKGRPGTPTPMPPEHEPTASR